MSTPTLITEDSPQQPEITYVYGGLLDPQNPSYFCTQIFPDFEVWELVSEEDARDAIEHDQTAELYRLNKETGEGTRLSNRLDNDSVFPSSIQVDYLKRDDLRMKLLNYVDILELSESEPQKSLRLHWQDNDYPAEETNPEKIIEAVRDGNYSSQFFDVYSYCCTEEDYQAKQADQTDSIHL